WTCPARSPPWRRTRGTRPLIRHRRSSACAPAPTRTPRARAGHGRRRRASRLYQLGGATPGRCPPPGGPRRSRAAARRRPHNPAGVIVEYIGQTRGWFCALHVLATALFDRPAFRTCVSHGIVLGNDGRKASKSLRNYPEPGEMFDKHGSDAVRLALMGSPV